MADYINIPINLFENEKLLLLGNEAYPDKTFLIWLELLLNAKRRTNRRFIYKVADRVELTDESMSWILKVDPDILGRCFEILERHGFIKRDKCFIEIFKVWDTGQRNRSIPEYQSWRKQVFERDHYTCQECGQVGGKLNAHHVIAWSVDKELRFDINNGITLCEKCHKFLHKKGE